MSAFADLVSLRTEQRIPILLDGATGTELDRRGIPTTLPLWSSHALLSPSGLDMLAAIHSDYAAAGCDIITACTFRTNPRKLEKAGLLSRGAELVALAVRTARNAAPRKVIAGSMAPVEDCYDPHSIPPTEDLIPEHKIHAEWLRDAGVDFLLIETMGSIREAEAALLAARGVGLPAVVSFSTVNGALLSGESIALAIDRISRYDPAAILLNCVPLSEVQLSLPQLKTRPEIGTGFYPNFGEVDEETGWKAEKTTDPELFADSVSDWVKGGVRWIGGCCGTQPTHIHALHKRYRRAI